MDKREKFVIELFLGLIFLVLLLIGVLLAVYASNNNIESSNTVVTDSFNTYNIEINPTVDSRPQYRDYQRNNYHDERRYDEVEHKDKFYFRDSEEREYLRYSVSKDFEIYKGVLGNDIGKYEVTIDNHEYVGGNFKVIFYFQEYGKVRTESITQYIPAKEEKTFTIRDISYDKSKNKKWWYDSESLTAVNK